MKKLMMYNNSICCGSQKLSYVLLSKEPQTLHLKSHTCMLPECGTFFIEK